MGCTHSQKQHGFPFGGKQYKQISNINKAKIPKQNPVEWSDI